MSSTVRYSCFFGPVGEGDGDDVRVGVGEDPVDGVEDVGLAANSGAASGVDPLHATVLRAQTTSVTTHARDHDIGKLLIGRLEDTADAPVCNSPRRWGFRAG